MVIFGAKKFFTENWVFSIFAKKLNKKFIFLEKKSIVQKKKNEPNFSTKNKCEPLCYVLLGVQFRRLKYEQKRHYNPVYFYYYNQVE